MREHQPDQVRLVRPLPVLNRALARERQAALRAPEAALLDLPEKAVQFGTGGFLRGFVDYFLDEANRKGLFGGRVVAIGSTGSGRDQVLQEQDGLFTLAIQGMDDGAPRREFRVVGSLSRAISARDAWDDVLACARNPDLELVFSNTTEVGIVLDEGDAATLAPPRSFPGKLTAFLHERARAFDFAPAKGVVVVPCELIESNGERLRAIVLELARRWELDARFARWVREAVPFCDTLVDRIVPGTPEPAQHDAIQEALGYRDELLTTCEVYRLFAIQPPPTAGRGPAARERLRFAAADPSIVITDDVTPYRERKVRLLNGAHTLMVPVALLCGKETVADAVGDGQIERYVRRAMFDEIIPSLDVPFARPFAAEVLERFANPFIRHALVDITLQGTVKMRVRVVPSIVEYAARAGRVPDALAFGFAAYLRYMRGDTQEARAAAGLHVPADEQGRQVADLWANLRDDSDGALRWLVGAACGDESLWGTDLTDVDGFAEAVTGYLIGMHRDGMRAALAGLVGGGA